MADPKAKVFLAAQALGKTWRIFTRSCDFRASSSLGWHWINGHEIGQKWARTEAPDITGLGAKKCTLSRAWKPSCHLQVPSPGQRIDHVISCYIKIELLSLTSLTCFKQYLSVKYNSKLVQSLLKTHWSCTTDVLLEFVFDCLCMSQ